MQQAGKSGRARGLVDMGMQPEAFQYKPPSGREPDDEVTLDAGGGHWFKIRTARYRGKIVDFALVHLWKDEQGERREIFRFDACHGEVHSHQFGRSGREIERLTIHRFEQQEGSWDLMDDYYYECNDVMWDQVNDRFERWKQS